MTDTATATRLTPLTDGITNTKALLAEARIHVAEAEAMLKPKRDALAEQIKALEEQFKAENAELLEATQELQDGMASAEKALREGLVKWHEETGLKTFDKDLSVRVNESLEYENSEAVEWAESEAKFLLLKTVDKKGFEMIAKDRRLPFVKFHKSITAVVAKNLGDPGE